MKKMLCMAMLLVTSLFSVIKAQNNQGFADHQQLQSTLNLAVESINKVVAEKQKITRVTDEESKKLYDAIADENQSRKKIIASLKKTCDETDTNYNAFFDKFGLATKLYLPCRKLEDIKKNINDINKNGKTPLILAAQLNEKEAINALLDSGVDVNDQNQLGDIALTWAHNAEIMELLLDRGAKINHPDKYGTTPLMKSAVKGDAELVETLLKRGAEIDLLDKNGNSALIWAATYAKNKKIVELLLDAGAKIDHQDKFGMTALMSAAMNENKETVELLLNRGAKINAVDTFGKTPLIWAVTYAENKETVELLLDRGAKIDLVVEEGKTILDYAENPEIIELLKQHGAR